MFICCFVLANNLFFHESPALVLSWILHTHFKNLLEFAKTHQWPCCLWVFMFSKIIPWHHLQRALSVPHFPALFWPSEEWAYQGSWAHEENGTGGHSSDCAVRGCQPEPSRMASPTQMPGKTRQIKEMGQVSRGDNKKWWRLRQTGDACPV